MITAATATTMIAPPSRIAGVTDSPSSSAPRRIATTGFTYAYVETFEIGAFWSSQT